MTELTAPGSNASIGCSLSASGVSRRLFLRFCAALAAGAPAHSALASASSVRQIADRIASARRPSVIWLHFQDCTGCTESLLHSAEPDIAEILFSLISLDYHETLMAASGRQAEAALDNAVRENAGNFILVVEGSIPTGACAGYMKLAGRNAIDVLHEVAAKAALVVAVGSCSSWGGVASADPNPSNARSVAELIQGKSIVNLPGCPPNPYTLLSVLLEFATLHRLPALDALGRPRFAYDRLIHEDCPRRGHFDAGRFASQFGDWGHRNGWCLYKLGCKGPVTHASCSTRHFNNVPNAWPIGVGAPCIGCTEQATAFRTPLFQLVDIHALTPAAALPSIEQPAHSTETAVAVTVGIATGIAASAAWAASRRLPSRAPHCDDEEAREIEELEKLSKLTEDDHRKPPSNGADRA